MPWPLPKFGSGGRLGRGLRCLVLRACRSERKALRRAAADETRAAPTNAGSFLDPLPARRWRRSRADVLPVDADGGTGRRHSSPSRSSSLLALRRRRDCGRLARLPRGLPARHRREDTGDRVSRAPIPIISPTLEAYLGLAHYAVIYTHRQFTQARLPHAASSPTKMDTTPRSSGTGSARPWPAR